MQKMISRWIQDVQTDSDESPSSDDIREKVNYFVALIKHSSGGDEMCYLQVRQ